ncbi:MAG: methyltransferase domain-containing protein [Actinobacteria bacterium]|nr:methyltransferase domain-containing protein [Actinomycetota bacterium]
MDNVRSSAELATVGAAAPPPAYLDARAEFAYRFLCGTGLEIGALNRRLPVPGWAKSRNVDRLPTDELRAAYAELKYLDLASVDVVDDGERLETIEAGSQDFIIANHFLEHTEDPIGTISIHLRKLKPGGVLFYAVPDKRFTFDHRREATAVDHILRDHEEGPAWSRREHYDEYGAAVLGGERDREEQDFAEQAERYSRELETGSASIHVHTFTASSFLAFLLKCRECVAAAFEIEAFSRHEEEVIAVLRRVGDDPVPASPPTTAPELVAETELLRTQIGQLERELARLKASSSWRVTEPLRAAKARLGGRR